MLWFIVMFTIMIIVIVALVLLAYHDGGQLAEGLQVRLDVLAAADLGQARGQSVCVRLFQRQTLKMQGETAESMTAHKIKK